MTQALETSPKEIGGLPTVKPHSVDDFKPKIEILEPSRVSQSLCNLIGAAVADSAFIAESAIDFIKEENADEQLGSEYMVSLNRLSKTNDWLIWASSGFEPSIDIEFYIIFHASLERKARETMKKLLSIYQYYFESEIKFKILLENLFLELEKR